jgi:hypothetical protein
MPVLREYCLQAASWLADVWGGEARRVQRRWQRVLADRPDLQADLADLGMLNTLDVDRQGEPLSAAQLHFRAGARFVALSLLGRARVTEAEWDHATKGDGDEGLGILEQTGKGGR